VFISVDKVNSNRPFCSLISTIIKKKKNPYAADCFSNNNGMNSGGFSKQFVGGIMALVMGIMTIIRMTSSMPRKITEAALYGGNSVYYDGSMMKAPAISNNEYMAMMKRMTELEEKVTVLSVKPVMPPEKEEMLNNALTRVSNLEQELGATKQVLVILLYFGK